MTPPATSPPRYPAPPCQPKGRGFSLIEVLAVLVVMGLLAAVLVLGPSTSSSRVGQEQSLEALAAWDQTLREHARRYRQPAAVTLDLAQGTMQASWSQEPGAPRKDLVLASGWNIQAAWVGTQKLTTGQSLALTISEWGWSPTYAVQLSSTKRGPSVWVLVSGLTGQCTVLKEENDLAALLQSQDDSTTGS